MVTGRSHCRHIRKHVHESSPARGVTNGLDGLLEEALGHLQISLLGSSRESSRLPWRSMAPVRSTTSLVNVSDFLSMADGFAIPSGIYDLIHNHRGSPMSGLIMIRLSFAVESIRRWWQQWGKALYPGKKALLITAVGGGSKGSEIACGIRSSTNWLLNYNSPSPWRITILPPCPWKKIEHRLFSFISINWRAKPLTSLEVVVELISHTTTKEGLTVRALKDSKTSPTGTKVTDEELAALHLLRDDFHGDWNSTFLPQASPSSGQLI